MAPCSNPPTNCRMSMPKERLLITLHTSFLLLWLLLLDTNLPPLKKNHHPEGDSFIKKFYLIWPNTHTYTHKHKEKTARVTNDNIGWFTILTFKKILFPILNNLLANQSKSSFKKRRWRCIHWISNTLNETAVIATTPLESKLWRKIEPLIYPANQLVNEYLAWQFDSSQFPRPLLLL